VGLKTAVELQWVQLVTETISKANGSKIVKEIKNKTLC